MKKNEHNPARLEQVEARLREEAKPSRSGPSPYLRTRIMAEVSSLHAERTVRSEWRWARIAAGSLAILLVGVMGLQRLSNRSTGQAPGLAQVGSWQDLVEQAALVTNQVDAAVADPFGEEFEALASDAREVTRFLAECIPL